jgi:hypothetical protein
MAEALQESGVQRVGFGLEEFCTAVGYCRASYYNLPAELRPRS